MNPKPHQRRGLGRGLGSLIPTSPRPELRDRDEEPVALRRSESDSAHEASDEASPERGRHALAEAPPPTRDDLGGGTAGAPDTTEEGSPSEAERSEPARTATRETGLEPDGGAGFGAPESSAAQPDSGADRLVAAQPEPGADRLVAAGLDASSDRVAPGGPGAGDDPQAGAATAESPGSGPYSPGVGAPREDLGHRSGESRGHDEVSSAHGRGSLRPAVPGVADWIGVPLLTDVLDRASGGATAATAVPFVDQRPTSRPAGPLPGPSGDPRATAAAGSAVADAVAPESTPQGSGDPTHASTGLQPVTGAWFAELAVADISPNPRQPREVFDEESMAELVQSILEVGLLQPVVVRPVDDDRYELVMGERRWRATQLAGLDTIPAIVRDTADDALLRDALLENLHRSQLNALEEAAAYQQLLEDFGCTHDELAARLGRSRPQISNTIRLLKLSPAVQRRVAAGVLSAGHARTLLGVEDAEVQDRLAGRVVAEGISVRGLEELVAVGDLGPEPGKGPRRRRPTAPGVEDLAARLSDRLDTRVRVELGKRKGRITVEFASLPDLERIVAMIDPGHPTRTRQDGHPE